jgi:DNA-binding beta-propeller fold protein YncE
VRGALLSAAVALAALSPGVRTSAPETGERLILHPPIAALIAGSRFPIAAEDGNDPGHLAVVGPGELIGDVYYAPLVSRAVHVAIVAARPHASATLELTVIPLPPPSSTIAVASYGDGVVIHMRTNGEIAGVYPLGGGAVDVARDGERYFALTTDAGELWTIAPGRLPLVTTNVPTGNEIATSASGIFVSNRDVNGDGALTRVRGAITRRVRTGVTAEGLAIDRTAHRIYVANVNSASVVEVDTRTLLVVRSFATPSRPFALLLDRASARLYLTANQSRSEFSRGGMAAAIDLASGKVVQISGPFVLPLGLALERTSHRLFVGEEGRGRIDVLDDRTLRERQTAIAACSIPWRLALDERSRMLYVPCAGSDEVAVLDISARPRPARFMKTGGYPLAVAL